jgi:hypothetical protein
MSGSQRSLFPVNGAARQISRKGETILSSDSLHDLGCGEGNSIGRSRRASETAATEPVLYPDAFDKFMGGTLRDQLN